MGRYLIKYVGEVDVQNVRQPQRNSKQQVCFKSFDPMKLNSPKTYLETIKKTFKNK